MQRRDIVLAIQEILSAIERTNLQSILKIERAEKARDDTSGMLRVLRDYSLSASKYSPAARALTQIFKLDMLEDPEIWLHIIGGSQAPAKMQLLRTVTTVRSEMPKILELLHQETVAEDQSIQGRKHGESPLSSVRITFVEDDGQFSTVQRLIEGLSACQEIYDGLQRLNGDTSVPLAIGAIDSGSDKSFDLFGAAALMKEFRELIVSLWGLVVFHREHKLGRRLELLAAALPILERVSAMEQSNRLGREEAQIIRNCFVEGTKKFVAAGVLTDDLSQHATHSPRTLLAPEPKLLTGPNLASQDGTASDEQRTTREESADGKTASLRNMSNADLERLADIMAAKNIRRSKDSDTPSNDDNELTSE